MNLGYVGSFFIIAFGVYRVIQAVYNKRTGKESRRIVGIIENTLRALVVFIMAFLIFTSVYIGNTPDKIIDTIVVQVEPLDIQKSPDPEYMEASPIYVQLASSRRNNGGFYIVKTQDDGKRHKLPIPETQIFFRPEGCMLEVKQYRIKDTMVARILGVENKVAHVTYTLYISNASVDLITNPDASGVPPYWVNLK